MLGKDTRNRKNKKTARRYRREMSISERVVWSILRQEELGFRFRRQFAIGPYYLDFYCPEAMLCVEVDGEQHLLTRDEDTARDAFLATKGILTMRIPSLDFFDPDTVEAEKFVDQVRKACEERTGRKSWDRKLRRR